MPKTKQQKKELVQQLESLVREAKAVVFSTFSKVDIKALGAVRRKFKEAGVLYKVFNKTLVKRALESNGIKDTGIDEWFGTIAVAASLNDEIAPAKMLSLVSKEEENVQLHGGIVGGYFIDAMQVKHLGSLPGREELVAKVIGSLNVPLFGLIQVLSGNQRALIYVLSHIRDKKS